MFAKLANIKNSSAGGSRDSRPKGAKETSPNWATDQARHRLRASSHFPLRTVSCSIHDGIAILRGQVPSFYCKQLAQSLVGGIAGIEEIDNRIEVVRLENDGILAVMPIGGELDY